jgi:hypothetical protein
MPQLLIFTDDLSGAADCAATCIGSGLNASMVFGDYEPRPRSGVCPLTVIQDILNQPRLPIGLAELLSYHTADE